MAELIDPSNYQDFTLQSIMTPDGMTRLNNIIRQLSQTVTGDTEAVRVFTGVGTPEASVSAGIGSLYMRTDGGADTAVYRKETGSGNTGWVAVKSPASLPLSVANGGTGADFSATTAGKYLYFSSTGVLSAADINSHSIQLFTSSGTFTAPTGVTTVYVSLAGSGGGGGLANTNSGGGGGGGASIINRAYTVIPGNAYTVTVGTATASGNGSATSFDTVLTAGGGTKGTDAGGGGGAGGAGAVAVVGIGTDGTAGGGAAPGVGGCPTFAGTAGGAGATNGYGGGGGSSQLGIGATGGAASSAGNPGKFGGGAGGGTANNGVGGTASGVCIVVY